MTLLRSALESLRGRVSHLEADLQAWRERTAVSGDLEQHHTQIDRVAQTLEATLADALGGTTVDPRTPLGPDASLGELADLPGFRRDIGTIHLLWEFFRDKFAQRDVDRFRDHLAAADELAWACYEPCLNRALTSGRLPAVNVKEPPLVFYAPDRTPFAKARTKTFHPQGLDSKDVAAFTVVLMSLPVPLIGVPWETAKRLPDLVLVGHEAGHIVAEDLMLAREAKDAVSRLSLPGDVDGVRAKIWRAWSDEVFADVFGVLATGASFVCALASELAADVDRVRAAPIRRDRPGVYPTPSLRIALVSHVLERLGLEPPPEWSLAYRDIIGDSRELAADVPLMARALLDREWVGLGDEVLTAALSWNPDRQASAEEVARAALAGESPDEPLSTRTWVAASSIASRADASRYQALDLDRVLSAQIARQRAGVVRGAQVAVFRGARSAAEADEENRRMDAARGGRIAEVLKLGRHSR